MNNLAKEIMAMNLLTTHQRLHKLRKNYSDTEIIEALEYCSIGVRSSITSLLNKDVVARYEAEEREVTESEKDYYE
jgi:hypothetical protein